MEYVWQGALAKSAVLLASELNHGECGSRSGVHVTLRTTRIVGLTCHKFGS